MTIGEILLQLAEKSGTITTSDAFQSLLKATESITVDESLNTSFDGLISIKNAKNNLEVKNHFFSQFADSVDLQLQDSFKGLGISEEIFATLKTSEPSTFKRISLLTKEAKKLQDDIEKSKGGSNKESELIAQYELKMSEIKSQYDASVQANQNLLSSHQADKMDWITTDYIRKNPLNTDLPFIDQVSKMAINDHLAKIGIKPILVNGKIELRQSADENLSFEGTYESVISKALAENKLLKNSNPLPIPIHTQNAQTQSQTQSQNHFATQLSAMLNS